MRLKAASVPGLAEELSAEPDTDAGADNGSKEASDPAGGGKTDQTKEQSTQESAKNAQYKVL